MGAKQRQETAEPELGEPGGEARPLQVIEETLSAALRRE